MPDELDSPVVLIVEDDPSLRLLLREILRGAGHSSLEAGDCRTALAMAREHGPDAILLDIGLPDGEGMTVLDDLRADDGLAGIPVIMVTARTEPRLVESALRRGARDFVHKPFDPAELLARVETAVRVSSSDDEPGAAGGEAGAPGGELGSRRRSIG